MIFRFNRQPPVRASWFARFWRPSPAPADPRIPAASIEPDPPREGREARIAMTLTGNPEPAVYLQWLIDGEDIDGAEGPAFDVPQESAGRALACRVQAVSEFGSAIALAGPVQIAAGGFPLRLPFRLR